MRHSIRARLQPGTTTAKATVLNFCIGAYDRYIATVQIQVGSARISLVEFAER